MKRFPWVFHPLVVFALVLLLVSGRDAGAAPGVTLSVSSVPPAPNVFPYGGGPKVGEQLTLTATATALPPGFSDTLYEFTAVLEQSGEPFIIQHLSTAKEVTWTAPKAGDYDFKVEVRKGAATASGTRNGFHVKPTGIPHIEISSSPPVMAQSGAFTISARVAPIPPSGPPQFPPVHHRIWFGYRLEFLQPPNLDIIWEGSESWHEAVGVHPVVWTPDPPLAPGAYTIQVHVQSFRNHMLMAEDTKGGASPAYFYRNLYVVLLPPGPCPTPAHTKDPRLPFGWSNPITTHNASNLPVATRQGAADCAVAGFSINDILNHPQLRVRKLNVSCTNCHINIARAWFCDALPGGFFHSQDSEPSATLETTLYKLFVDWKNRGCPEPFDSSGIRAPPLGDRPSRR
jgi:hypothetical protein